MSMYENNMLAPWKPWIGSTICKNSLSVVVISTNSTVIDKISEALIDVHAMCDFRWKLVVLRSLCINDIAEQSALTGELTINFIILAVDSSRLLCLEWANKMLEQIHPDLRIRCVVLVNVIDSTIRGMEASTGEFISFCSEKRLDMITTDLSTQKDANFLARRLLKYIEVSIGINTGIPNLNI